jgi:hypothetical protein
MRATGEVRMSGGYDQDDRGHAPVERRRRQLRTATPGNAQRVGDFSWTNEPNVWCAGCRNYRFASHTAAHDAALVSGGFVPGVTASPGSPWR